MSKRRALVRRVVEIPGDLRAFLSEVSGRIERGEPDALTASDDLLQGSGVYGGRNEEGGDVWGFTYFPTDDWHPKWELALTRDELRGIAEGTVREVALWFCPVEGCGYAYPSEEWECGCPGVWKGREKSEGKTRSD